MDDMVEIDIEDFLQDFSSHFTFYTAVQGRQFTFVLESVEEDEGKTFVVYSTSDTGETEFFHTYELNTDTNVDAFLDELYNIGKSLGAKEAEAFVKSFGREVDKRSVNA